MTPITTTQQLQSILSADGIIRLRLVTTPLPEPAAREVLIRIEAAPINPSDLGAMIGPADVSRMQVEGGGDAASVAIPMPSEAMPAIAGRSGQPLAAGIEGSGVVVGAGSSAEAQALIGKLVAVSTGAMYARHRIGNADDLLVAKKGTSAVEAALPLSTR